MTYHLVWCPKYRHRVLTNPVAERLDHLLRSKVAELEGEIAALEIQPDHVHLFAKFPPTLAVYQIMHHDTSYSLRREFPRLKHHLPSLWTRSYYVGTAGKVSAETIRRYIKAQKDR